MFSGYFAAHSCDCFYSFVSCFLHTFSQDDRVSTCFQVLHSFVDHCLSKNSSGRSTVTGYIVGLGSYFFYQLCAHVLERIFQLNLFCNGNTIVSDQRSTELFVKDYVSSFRSDRYTNGICKFIYTGFQCFSGVNAIF